MEFLVVTGLSGAGKTQASHAFEDMGYYCIDNIPVNLLEKFLQLCAESQNGRKYCAIIDIRAVLAFGDISKIKDKLATPGITTRILYLDAADEVLIRRYKETRRRHPMQETEGVATLVEAVAAERAALAPARQAADIVIDTSSLLPLELKAKLADLFSAGQKGMSISFLSFGFKHALPVDADLLFDVRCLPNPFYDPELRGKRGTDSEVADFVFSFEDAQALFQKIAEFLEFSIPLYQKEGKSSLIVGIGCTGGHHRSVAFCEALSKRIGQQFGGVSVLHRDIGR